MDKVRISAYRCDGTPERELDVREAMRVLAAELDQGAAVIRISKRQIRLAIYRCVSPCRGEDIIFSGEGPGFERLAKVARDAFTFVCGENTWGRIKELQDKQPSGEGLKLDQWELLPNVVNGWCHEDGLAGSLAILCNLSPEYFDLVRWDATMGRTRRWELVKELTDRILNPDGSRR